MVHFHFDGIWYQALPAEDGCKGCIFDGDSAKVCKAAGKAAQVAEVPDCESLPRVHKGFIYKLDLSAGRQRDLFRTTHIPQLEGVQ